MKCTKHGGKSGMERRGLITKIKRVLIGVFTVVVVQCLVIAKPFAETDDWELRKTEDGISVYTRPVPDSPINAIRAEAEIAVPMPVVKDLLLNFESRTKWNSLCKEAEKVTAKGDTTDTQFAYFYYDMPWPVKDRDLVISFTVDDGDTATTISGSAVEDMVEPNSKAVRVTHAWEKWLISKKSDESTMVSMTVFMDPNGPIPAWLINSMSVSQPLDAMAKIRELAAASVDKLEK